MDCHGMPRLAIFRKTRIFTTRFGRAVRTVGLLTLLCCLPASYIMKPRFTGKDAGILNFALFRDIQFNLLLACGFLSMFPIFVVPYFIPQFARAIDL